MSDCGGEFAQQAVRHLAGDGHLALALEAAHIQTGRYADGVFFVPLAPQPMPEPVVEERLTKEIRFDPDAWIVETEDREGRHFLELAKT